jgi:hypothetical protein
LLKEYSSILDAVVTQRCVDVFKKKQVLSKVSTAKFLFPCMESIALTPDDIERVYFLTAARTPL